MGFRDGTHFFINFFSWWICNYETRFYICTPKHKEAALTTANCEIKWSVRLGVRTPGFHPGNRGSIPLRTTIKGSIAYALELFLFLIFRFVR